MSQNNPPHPPDPQDDFFDDNPPEGDLDCPNCGREYDEIDFEFQICHFCKFNNNDPNSRHSDVPA